MKRRAKLVHIGRETDVFRLKSLLYSHQLYTLSLSSDKWPLFPNVVTPVPIEDITLWGQGGKLLGMRGNLTPHLELMMWAIFLCMKEEEGSQGWTCKADLQSAHLV